MCVVQVSGAKYLIFEVNGSIEVRDLDVVGFAEHFALDWVLEDS